MSDDIQVGDRVWWYSTRANNKGIRMRVGVVLKIYNSANGFAFVKPEKGNGKYQYISLRRLKKIVAAQSPTP